jgi:hypothetical protein
MRPTLILLTMACLIWSPAPCGEIRGLIVDFSGHPVVNGEATIRRAGENSLVLQLIGLQADGSYRFLDLPAGEYDLILMQNSNFQVIVRGVRVEPSEVQILPTIQLEPFTFCGQPHDTKPQYYRLSTGPGGTGGLSGRIEDEEGNPVPRAALSLFGAGIGKLGSTNSLDSGEFSFNELRPALKYWISVSVPGFFADELRELAVRPGLNAVHFKKLEACAPDHCQPYLKSIPIVVCE